MKKILVVLLIEIYFTNLFALTPHINKGELEEISLSQAMNELELSEQEIKDINKEFYGVLESNSYFPAVQEADYDSPVQIFKQTFQETDEILYRVMSYTEEPEPFAKGGIFQKGYYSNGQSKPNLIFAEFYEVDATVFGQSITSVRVSNNFMPIIKENKIAGIMIYGIERYNEKKSIIENEGSSEILNHKAAVYWRKDFSTADLRNTYSNSADIYIDCSNPLIDEKNTFKYTIQNAFDKNPATSYVEDTEDDLMYISFGSQRQLEKIALINGYTVNEKLYKMNNRIKDIACESMNDKNYEIVINNRFSLKDLIYTYQILELNTQANYTCIPSIIIESYYKGSSYSDTCIAEVDYLFQKDGWLFGGINWVLET